MISLLNTQITQMLALQNTEFTGVYSMQHNNKAAQIHYKFLISSVIWNYREQSDYLIRNSKDGKYADFKYQPKERDHIIKHIQHMKT